MVAIPRCIGEITADWLCAAVRAQHADAFSNLISVETTSLGQGVGTTSDLHRLRLVYPPGARRGPESLIAKLPSTLPAVREMARGWGQYEREVLFYRDIAATVAMRIPTAYVAEFDAQTQRFVLVMEDLAPATDGNQVAGLSPVQARMALDQIASLHAAWWNHPQLRALETAIRPFGEGAWRGAGARHGAAWPAFEPFLAARASPAFRRVAERMAATVEPMMIDIARGARTLCHGDFRADNLMFAHSGELITVDWQAPLQARGAFDVGLLMSMSVTTEVRRAYEAHLLRSYHEKLVAGGVGDYAYDAFLHDYRRGLLIGFTYVVQGGAAADLTHPRAEALFDSAVRRTDAAMQDHGLEEFAA